MELICLSLLFVAATSAAPDDNGTLTLSRNKKSHLVKRFAYYGTKWRGGVVPYTVGPNLEQIHGIIQNVSKDFADKTCIRLLPRKPSDNHYVQFVQNDQGNSICGSTKPCKRFGVHNISISPRCMDHYVVAHEFAHAICMAHEHQRPDRDKFITFECEEPSSELRSNIWKIDYGVSTPGLMYDYMSLMHFQECRKSSCLKPLDPGLTNCGVTRLSFLDAEKINSLYNCGGCHGYRFRHSNWDQTKVFVAGWDTDNVELGVCRAYLKGNIIIGKKRRDENKCRIPFKKLEHEMSEFEILAEVDRALFGWHFMKKGQPVPTGAIAGGRNIDGVLKYIGRCYAWQQHKLIITPGNIVHGQMIFSHQGKEYECENFQILRCMNTLP